MPLRLALTINSVSTIAELPGYWSADRLRALLRRLEFEGIDDVTNDQLREYAVMALQDLEPAEAARALLDVTLGNKLSAGKLQNISEEMEVERLWEEYPDLSCHEPIFNAQTLLSQAFPSVQTPEINLVEASLQSLDAASEGVLKEAIAKSSLPEAIIVRCLAAASSESSILNRLFEDQIAGQPFPEAEHLVWHAETAPAAAGRPGLDLSLFSPVRWTSSLEEGQTVECAPASTR